MLQIIDISEQLPVNPAGIEIPMRNIDDIEYLVLHCTEKDWSVWKTAEYHVTPDRNHHIDTKGCPTICYTFFIEKDGRVFQTLDWKIKGWHVGKWNRISLGAVLRYECGENDELLPVQWEKAVELFAYLANELDISIENIVGHRELEETGYYFENGKKVLRKECPGLKIDLDLFRKQVQKKINELK